MAHVRKTEPTGRGRPGEPAAAGPREGVPPGSPPLEQKWGAAGPRLEEVVGRVLRYGSLLSTAVILLGVALLAWSARFGPDGSAGALATVQPAAHTPSDLLAGLRGGDPLAVISLGLLLLIATPVARVASTVVYFWWKGDRVYLAITSFVLLVLLVGFVVGSSA